MSENKPTGAAAKVAASTQTAGAAKAEEQKSEIQVGATAGGSRTNEVKPAGVQEAKRPPGYYSRHAGKVRIGRKVWVWPMEAPLVPKEDEPELKEFLDSMVERNLAELVK